MTKTSNTPVVRKTLKVGGAALSLAWSMLGATIMFCGTAMVINEKSKKLAVALQS